MNRSEAGTESITERGEKALIPQTTVWLMAITVGVIVANIYYVQPLLAEIAGTFDLSRSSSVSTTRERDSGKPTLS